jgi:predicted Zn-dependent peptidase
VKHSLLKRTLKNGIELVIIDVPKSNLFNITIAVKSGYRFTTGKYTDKYETPHILEHMLFDGSRSFPSNQALEEIFTNKGGSYNGVTTPYHNIYMIESKAAIASTIISAALDMVYKPILSVNSFSEEIKVVENELQEYMGDFELNAGQYNQQRILPDLLVSTDNQLSMLPNITHTDVTSYHKEYYGTKNTSLYITCDTKKISVDEIENYIIESTKGVRMGKKHKLPILSYTEESSRMPIYVKLSKSIKDSYSNFNYIKSGELSRPDFVKLNLFAGIASSMKSYSVNYKLRKKGHAYNFTMSPIRSIETYGIEFNISTNTKEYVNVVSVTMNLINDLLQGGITNEEFETYKRNQIESLSEEFASESEIEAWYFEDLLMEVDVYSKKELIKNISSITLEEMLEFVANVFKYENQFITIFTAKGIRASMYVDIVSKGILLDIKNVDSDTEREALPINTRQLIIREFDKFYTPDETAGPFRKFVIFINTHPLLAWIWNTMEFIIGSFLIYVYFSNYSITNVWDGLYLVLLGIVICCDSMLDVFIRILRYKEARSI